MSPDHVNWDDAVVIAVGSNLPDAGTGPAALAEAALARLPARGLRVLARSSWWRSAAWPDPAQPDYINGVAIVDTRLSPAGVLDALHAVEAEFGRLRHEKNAPRTLDLDLIAYGRLVAHAPGLTVPHPRAADRLFVMGPLAQIAPDWRHPQAGATAAELAAAASVGLDATPVG